MYIHRPVYETLYKQKDNRKITILIGARQVGKTSLMRAIYNALNAGGARPCLFLDLDLYSNYEKVSTYENLINTLNLNGYHDDQDNCFFLFLDEFQRYADVSMVLKNVVDHHGNIKVYASGSSSLGIKSKIQETLAGRKRTVRIYPLSFYEFLCFSQAQEALENLGNIPRVSSMELNRLAPALYKAFDDFLVCGGYPEVALVSKKERVEVFDSIFDLYVKKELVDYLKIEKVKNAKTLIRSLAVNNGGETKYNDLGQIAGLDEKTVKNYIELLKETFLVTPMSPWFTNKNREIVKMPKIYFSDNGVRNYFINNFNPPDVRPDAPFLFEGYVISELIKRGVKPDMVKFWRTKNQMEVDIILESAGERIPVEVKYKQKVTRADLRGLKSYCASYPETERSYLVNPYNNTEMGNIRLLSPFDLDVLTAEGSWDV